MGNPANISLEPLLNEGDADGVGARVTAVSEVGACSHRTAVTVSVTAQEITIGTNKTTIELQNTGTNNIYYGGTGVDATKGIILHPDVTKAFSKVKTTFSIYVVCATGETSTLRIAEYA